MKRSHLEGPMSSRTAGNIVLTVAQIACVASMGALFLAGLTAFMNDAVERTHAIGIPLALVLLVGMFVVFGRSRA